MLNPLDLIPSPYRLIASGLAIASVMGSVWYAYDYIFERPVRKVTVACKVKTDKIVFDNKVELDKVYNEILIKNEALRQAGIVINKQGQTIYNMTIQTDKNATLHKLYNSECQAKLDKLKKEILDAKINNDSPTFYINYGF